jgi:prepilin-type N-terminal cleavage/methylation domain-containing protein
MRRVRAGDGGFTLVELLISIALVTVIMGAISSALIVFLKNGVYTSQRDDHSGGAIIGASYLERDVASASTVATGGTLCSGATNALLLEWDEYQATSAAPTPAVVPGNPYRAAYVLTSDGTSSSGAAQFKLERVYCPPTGTAVRSTVVRALPAGAFVKVGSPSFSCPVSSTALAVTLAAYGSDPTPAFTYSGCVKARRR